ncbi:MAG: hypothetical protein NTV93_07820 [Verrucomicrobia bacterium]|nr:hypothetical protein [Verrucomicrobiota bacterium]
MKTQTKQTPGRTDHSNWPKRTIEIKQGVKTVSFAISGRSGGARYLHIKVGFYSTGLHHSLYLEASTWKDSSMKIPAAVEEIFFELKSDAGDHKTQVLRETSSGTLVDDGRWGCSSVYGKVITKGPRMMAEATA